MPQLPFRSEHFLHLEFCIVIYMNVVYCFFGLLTRSEAGRKEIVVGRVPAQRRDLQFLNSNDESECRLWISKECLWRRLDRVLSFFSSRWNWDPLAPSPLGEWALLGGGHTRLRVREWGIPIGWLEKRLSTRSTLRSFLTNKNANSKIISIVDKQQVDIVTRSQYYTLIKKVFLIY